VANFLFNFSLFTLSSIHCLSPAQPHTLGRIGDPLAIDPLISLMNDENHNVRQSAARALSSLGEPLGFLIYESLQGDN
jgi:HEAT repeat protein